MLRHFNYKKYKSFEAINNLKKSRKELEERQFKKTFSIESIIGLISIVVSVNYFLSYQWFNGLLKSWYLNSKSILVFEDLIFPFANVNLTVFALSSMGFLWIFIWYFINGDEIDFVKEFEDLKNSFNKKNRLFIIILFLVFFSFKT